VIAVNKWDLVEKDANTALEYEHALKSRLKVFDYVPDGFHLRENETKDI
jgi:GTP-binding protein